MKRHLSALSIPVPVDEALVDVLLRETEAHPEWADIQNRWGLYNWVQGELEIAEAFFRGALEINPRYAWATLNLATVLWCQDRRDEAEAILAETDGPETSAMALTRGWMALLDGDMERGLASLEGLHARDHARPDVLWLRAAFADGVQPEIVPGLWQKLLSDEVLENSPETITAFKTAPAGEPWRTALFPGIYQLWYGLGEIHARLGDFESAREAARVGHVFFSDTTRYLNHLGFIAAMEGDEESLVQHHEAALASSSRDPFSAAALARYWAGQDALDKAHHYLKISLDRAPKYADLQRLMGQMEMARGNFAEALGYTRRALDINPRYKTARIEEASILFHLRIWSEAETSYRMAVGDDLVSSDVMVHLGRCLELQGKDAEAESAYREAVELNDHEILAHYRLGRIHRNRGDEAGAGEWRARTEALCGGAEHAFLPPSYPHFIDDEEPLPGRRAS